MLSLPFLLAPVLAWSPTPDASVAQQIVDSIYNRINPVSTLLTLDLKVDKGAFPTGSEVGLLYGDPKTCLANWLQTPTEYAKFGSRPVAITLAGQANQVALVAQSARNAFKNISGKDALAAAQQKLPAGHLQVYVQIAGLKEEFQRGAYNLGIMLSKDNFLRPYKIAYLEDWQKSSDKEPRWSGTMLYYFDLSKTTVDPTGKISLVLQTEANSNCTYTISTDLSQFY